MESVSTRQRAALISVFAAVAIFAIKVWAYQATHSAAVLSDATESVVNVVAAIVAFFVVRYAAQPADENHPYGHGKAEYFSSTFEGGMIFFAGLTILYQSVRAFFAGEELHQLESGLIIIGVAAIFNLVLGIYLGRVAKKQNSAALKASSAHVLSDVWITIGVIFGLILVILTKMTWIDPLVAVLVALQLTYSGYKIVREAMGGLIDEVDPTSLEALGAAMSKNRSPGIIDIHRMRVIRSGAFHHVDAHLVVPEYWDVAHAHFKTHEFELAVVRDYPFDGEIVFHLDPCARAYCSQCDVFDCPIRVSEFKKQVEFTVEHLTSEPSRKPYASGPTH
jgi:cation diffusion facilitator family transporter